MLISAPPDALRLLGDPLRARIAEFLAEGPACTCHLVEELGATQSNISNHLRVLREAGLVATEPRGRFTYYRLLPEPLEAAAGHLTALAARARDTSAIRQEC